MDKATVAYVHAHMRVTCAQSIEKDQITGQQIGPVDRTG